MREKFFKNEISENISQKFHTSEGLSTLIYVKFKGASWKTDLDDFADEFDSRHDINLNWGDDIKFKRILCRDLRENYIGHCLFVWIFLGLEVVHVLLMTRQL